jgi:hypothetical protein
MPRTTPRRAKLTSVLKTSQERNRLTLQLGTRLPVIRVPYRTKRIIRCRMRLFADEFWADRCTAKRFENLRRHFAYSAVPSGPEQFGVMLPTPRLQTRCAEIRDLRADCCSSSRAGTRGSCDSLLAMLVLARPALVPSAEQHLKPRSESPLGVAGTFHTPTDDRMEVVANLELQSASSSRPRAVLPGQIGSDNWG